jgi:hypothetical protein
MRLKVRTQTIICLILLFISFNRARWLTLSQAISVPGESKGLEAVVAVISADEASSAAAPIEEEQEGVQGDPLQTVVDAENAALLLLGVLLFSIFTAVKHLRREKRNQRGQRRRGLSFLEGQRE